MAIEKKSILAKGKLQGVNAQIYKVRNAEALVTTLPSIV